METIICIDCGIEKESHNFALEGPNGQFRRNKCKSCIKIWNKLPKAERDRIKAEQKDIIRTRIEKICPCCGELKPREAYYKTVSKTDGMSTECKVCDNHRNKERHTLLISNKIQNKNDVISHQVCKNCNIEQEIKHFSKNVGRKSGYCNVCKTCSSEQWAKSADKNRVNWLLNRIRAKCNKEGIDFDLTIEDLVIPEICPILGIPLRFGKSDKGYTSIADESSPSVDRIDPNGGYVKNNIIIISWRANRIKGNASIEELIKLADFYKRFLTD